MLFGSPRKLALSDHFSIIYKGLEVKRVTEFKYLGIIFDEILSWNEHVKSIVSKAGKRIGQLGRVRRYITSHSANTVYLSMIRPLLEYSTGVWTNCGKVNSNNLETLQKRAARVVTSLPRSDPALRCLKWTPLEERREDNVYKLVKKSIKGQCPQYFKNYFNFNRDVCSRITRQSNLLHLPTVKSNIVKGSFYYHGCKVFNQRISI